MPRDGSGVYHTPAGTHGVPDTTILSANYNNNVDDVANDLNYPRPIVAGGTGSTSAANACTALGAVQKAGDTMTGQLTISAGNAGLALNKINPGSNVIYGLTNNNLRWEIQPGNGENETGGNVGSNFGIYRYSDVGGLIDAPIIINRASGNVAIANSLQVYGNTLNGGDFTTSRTGNAAQGVVFFGNTGTHYLLFDGTQFSFSAAAVNVSGTLGVSSNLNVGGTVAITGALTAGSDITTYRAGGAPTTGYYFFGNSATKYLGFDGNNFLLDGFASGLNLIPGTGSNTANINCYSGAGGLYGLFGCNGSSMNVFSNSAQSTGMYIVLGGSAWTALSDARMGYKRTSRPLTALNKLASVQLYENEVNGKLELFGKAQEINRVFPHIVKQGSGDDDYVPTGASDDKAWGVSYERMGIIALQAVKELLAKVEVLENKIAALEAK